MEDGDHPELDFDPLDDTKLWPKEQFPWQLVGKMVLNRNPEDYFTEVEQAAFGTGVLVDGMDFSDDKMLQGRTFSYSDTQRHRVGANYLQLPINAPKKHVATNQRGGQMQIRVDKGEKQDPHINYEPSILDGLKEAPKNNVPYQPYVEGHLQKSDLPRDDNTKQAGETYREFEQWEKDDLILNLTNDLSKCDKRIQEKMIAYAEAADEEYGRRLRESLEKGGNSEAGPLGNTGHHGAVQDAIDRSHETDRL